MDQSIELAETIADNGPLAVRSAKRLMRLAFNDSTLSSLATEAEEFGQAFAMSEQKEGMRAFVEKRSAKFEDVPEYSRSKQ